MKKIIESYTDKDGVRRQREVSNLPKRRIVYISESNWIEMSWYAKDNDERTQFLADAIEAEISRRKASE